MRTGDEPYGEDDEQGGADVGHEDLARRKLQRYESLELQSRRRVGWPIAAAYLLLDLLDGFAGADLDAVAAAALLLCSRADASQDQGARSKFDGHRTEFQIWIRSRI
jgi:hypothetical protein